MGMWEAIVLIVIVVVIGRVMRGGRWNRETRRWEYDRAPDIAQQQMLEQVPQLRADIARLQERVATLEKLTTDPGARLAAEIEALRQIEPARDRDRPAA